LCRGEGTVPSRKKLKPPKKKNEGPKTRIPSIEKNETR